MPILDLSDDEIRDVCMALRAAAHRATQDAAAMAQSSKDHGFADTARRYTALFERFTAARFSGVLPKIER
jgi:hypothetical protein